MSAGVSYSLAHRLAFVTAEVIHHNDVAGRERWGEDALDIGSKDVTVYRAVQYPRCVDPVMAKRRDEGRRVPVAERSGTRQPLALRPPAPERRHVGLGPGLVDEHKPRGVDLALMSLPSLAAALYVRAFALVGDQRLFLKLKPQPRRNRQTVSWLTITPRAASRS